MKPILYGTPTLGAAVGDGGTGEGGTVGAVVAVAGGFVASGGLGVSDGFAGTGVAVGGTGVGVAHADKMATNIRLATNIKKTFRAFIFSAPPERMRFPS